MNQRVSHQSDEVSLAGVVFLPWPSTAVTWVRIPSEPPGGVGFQSDPNTCPHTTFVLEFSSEFYT